jgi:hypothetical protein
LMPTAMRLIMYRLIPIPKTLLLPFLF